MPINTYAELLSKVQVDLGISTRYVSGNLDGCLSSFWNITSVTIPPSPGAGVAPSGAASVCDSTTTGSLAAFTIPDQTGLTKRFGILYMRQRSSLAPTTGFTMLVDRLAHKGGLNANIITQQDVSTPSLTRYTSGVGVCASVDIYSTIGSTVANLTMNYTNTLGQLKTSPSVPIGGSVNQANTMVVPISLAIGDVGIQSVQNIQLDGATGAVGNFGITLYKTLAFYPWVAQLQETTLLPVPAFTGFPIIQSNACPCLIIGGGSNGFGPAQDPSPFGPSGSNAAPIMHFITSSFFDS